MSLIPDNVRQELEKLVPSSLINNIACFVFYDDHPSDKNHIDITICTTNGEVKEFYQRDLLSSLSLDCSSLPTEIKIMRNRRSKLFYLVSAGDALFILSRKDQLEIHQKLTNVDKYDVEDSVCRGHACLKVIRKDDAVPLIYDDNFENLGDRAFLFSSIHADDSLPLLTHIKRKLTEAKYSVKCNEKTLKELIHLHQLAAFSTYQKIHPNLKDSVFNKDFKELTTALKMKTQTPWVKVCNGKIVIALFVSNQDNVPVEDVHILLHGTTKPSMVYTCKLFENHNSPPFWRETETCSLKCNHETAVVVIIDMEEIKNDILSPIEFNGVIVYKKMGKEFLLPIDNVIISSTYLMGEEFDALSSNQIDENKILALLATSEKTDLVLRHIKDEGAPDLDILEIFCKHLLMERVLNTENTIVHRKSPCHTLNGVMIIFQRRTNSNHEIYNLSVFSKSSSQILALIHFIHDAIPFKLVITTPDQKITAKSDNLSNYNELIPAVVGSDLNHVDYGLSILKRTSMILEYLNDSMLKMSKSKNPIVLSKIGCEIDLFAGGVASYMEFRNNMLDETLKSIKSLSNEISHIRSEGMIVD